jgi:uncharacterized protein YraI
MLPRARHFLFALLALTLASATPALAGNTGYGTPAWSRAPLTLLDGPGAGYAVVGAIADDQAITVYRCTVSWCLVQDGRSRGWAALSKLHFGLSSADPLTGPRLNYGSGGPGQVCFFEGANYTGASVCMGPGQVFKDLKLARMDNRFSSVSVEGHVSAAVCRDSDFQSYCTRIITSQPVLNRYLNREASSIRVY